MGTNEIIDEGIKANIKNAGSSQELKEGFNVFRQGASKLKLHNNEAYTDNDPFISGFLEKLVLDKQTLMSFSEVSKKWINNPLIISKVVDVVLVMKSKKNLSNQKTLKLLAVMLAIPYAEEMQDRHGVLANYFYEQFIKGKEVLKEVGEPSSHTIFQVPIPRLKDHIKTYKHDLQEQIDELRRIMTHFDDDKAVRYVSEIVTPLLDAPPEKIFAIYNSNDVECTRIASLQLFMNVLRSYAESLLNLLGPEDKLISDVDLYIHSHFENNPKYSSVHGNHIRWVNEKELEAIKKTIKLWSSQLDKTHEGLKVLKAKLSEDLKNWPICTVDGGFGSSIKGEVRRALNAALSFFNHEKQDDELLKKEKVSFHELYHFLEGAGLSVHLSEVVFIPAKKDSKEDVYIESVIMQIIENRHTKDIEELLREQDKLVEQWQNNKQAQSENWSLLTFFRRTKLNNDFCVHDYVTWALSAYNVVIKYFNSFVQNAFAA